MKKFILLMSSAILFIFTQNQNVFATKITIIHTNDVHGKIDCTDESLGYVGISQVLEQSKKTSDYTLLIDAGDVIQGDTFVSYSSGKIAFELMNILGYEYLVPGNHEFDYGKDHLIHLAQMAKFKILASNLYDNGERLFLENDIIKLGDLNIGVFGLVSPETPMTTQTKNTVGLQFTSPVEAAKEQVNKLREKGANFIVAITHLGIAADIGNRSYDVCDNVSGIDIIIDGHSHSTSSEIEQKDGLPPIVSTGAYLRNIGIISIDTDDCGHVVKICTKIHCEKDDVVCKNKELVSKIYTVSSEVASLERTEIARTETPLNGDLVRVQETNLSRFVADALLHSFENIDIAFISAGSIRDSINPEDGVIRLKHVKNVFPFGNKVSMIKIRGIDIQHAIEHGLSKYPIPAGKFPQVAGLTCFVCFGDKGPIVHNLKISGNPVNLDKLYNVVTSDFMADGNDGYKMLCSSTNITLCDDVAQVITEYFRKVKLLTKTMYSDTRIFIKKIS